MVFEQEGAGGRKAAGAIVGNERLEIGAAANIVRLAGQVRPDARSGRFDHGIIDGFIAYFRHSLLQGRVHRVRFDIHATPPRYARYSFCSLSRVRESVTATVPGVVLSSCAISGFSFPSKKRRMNMWAIR